MLGMNDRLSIAKLMLIVSLAAAECAFLRFVWDTTPEETIIALPMLNFMLFGLWKLRPGHAARPFWVGFETIVMITFGLMACLYWFAPEILAFPLQWLTDHNWIGSGDQNVVTIIAWLVAIYALPPLLMATLAGWLSGRYRIVIIRRSRRTGDQTPQFEPEAEGEEKEIQRTGQVLGRSPYPTVN